MCVATGDLERETAYDASIGVKKTALDQEDSHLSCFFTLIEERSDVLCPSPSLC